MSKIIDVIGKNLFEVFTVSLIEPRQILFGKLEFYIIRNTVRILVKTIVLLQFLHQISIGKGIPDIKKQSLLCLSAERFFQALVNAYLVADDRGNEKRTVAFCSNSPLWRRDFSAVVAFVQTLEVAAVIFHDSDFLLEIIYNIAAVVHYAFEFYFNMGNS